MELSSRPLTLADDDQRLYVTRAVDDAIADALRLNANVLLRSRRGAGATSLLNRVEGRVGDVVHVNAAGATSTDDVVHAVVARARVPRQLLADVAGRFNRRDPLAAPSALDELRDALRAEDRHVTALVDGPVDPTVAHDLFGRFRDDVFAVPASWIVTAHDARSREYLTPPADVFFEDIVAIDDFDDDKARELLRRRGVLEQLDEHVVDSVLAAHDGTPRSIITLARRQLRRDPHDSAEMMRAYRDATAALGPTATSLLAELQLRDRPAAATDDELGRRLGVHARTLRRAFAQLEETGLVEPVPSGGGAPGRPPATFVLTDVGRAGGVPVA